MFYWLNSFSISRPSSIRAWFEPHLLHRCLTFYAITKWPDGLTGWRGTVTRPACRAGPPFGHLYVEVWFGTWRLVTQTGRVCNELI
jgi:hypothetical protein